VGDLALAPRLQVSEIQRSRLLAAAVKVVEQYGYSHTTVTRITARARVSRRTFYELFDNREDCLLAMSEDAVATIAAEIDAAELDGLSWRERIRGGLAAILRFFDREPTIARVCVVQMLRGDERVLERRAEILAGLADAIDEGREASARGGNVPALTAEGLVGAADAIVYARLLVPRDTPPGRSGGLKPDDEPLMGLLNGLMSMIVLPYLGPEAARREQARALPKPRIVPAAENGEIVAEADRNPLESLPMRVTYRTAMVLERIAEQPGISNREVADQAGIADQGQMSKLLSRLQRLGLIANTGRGHSKGEPNAWTLTPTGLRVAQSILP
jgi:AcrR family transcriptional regulator/DNA-binding MarR family transcriptional regulator